jgi:type VI secretion system protein ImpF
MAAGEVERNVQLSVLDRLIDQQPESRVDAPMSRSESLRRFRRSIKRDLEFLLNSVRNATPIPDHMRQLRTSVFRYGLPDLNGVALENPQDEARLLRSMEEAISTYEPRLKRVRVTASERLTKKKSSLVLHVEAMLMVDPAPEPIAFDTVLEIAKGSYSVRDENFA